MPSTALLMRLVDIAGAKRHILRLVQPRKSWKNYEMLAVACHRNLSVSFDKLKSGKLSFLAQPRKHHTNSLHWLTVIFGYLVQLTEVDTLPDCVIRFLDNYYWRAVRPLRCFDVLFSDLSTSSCASCSTACCKREGIVYCGTWIEMADISCMWYSASCVFPGQSENIFKNVVIISSRLPPCTASSSSKILTSW